MNYNRREFLKLAGTVAAGSLMAACTPTLTPKTLQDSGGEKVQLVYQDWRTDWFPEMAQRLLEKFHDTHPNVRVFYTPDPDNLEEEMLADMENETAPDVLQGCCDFFPIWAQKGYLLDLKPYIDADLSQDLIKEWDPAQYKALSTREGVQFGLPKYHGALAIFYNKDLFDQKKVDYPPSNWNHDDYLEIMKKLTQDEDNNGLPELWGSMMDISWERIQVHINAWGGHLVDPNDPTISWMARPEALAAMDWIRNRMWSDKVMASLLDVQNIETRQAFITQKIAMVEDGSWALKDILDGAKFRVGVIPFPAGPARRVTLATTDGFGIYAGTKHPEAAWELIKFLVGEEYALAMAEANFLQPARASLVDQWMRIIQDQFPKQTRDMDLSAFAEGHIQGYSVTAEIFANMAEARRLVKNAWDQIFTLGQDSVDLMKRVSQQVEAAQR